MTTATKTVGGFRTFLVVWAGQLVSLIGTNLTGFALAIWVYQETGSTTQLSFVLLATSLPQLLITPFAGALVDRWDRRKAMLLSDTGAGVGTIIIVVLLATDSLEIWHLYPILAVSGMFQAFQWPAYTAATTLLVSKEHYGRAAGMVQLAEAIGQVIAPALAGAILVLSGLEMVILLDVITFLFAIGTLLTVRFPATPETAAGTEGRGKLLAEARFGWDYIRARRGLLGMLTWAAVINLLFGGLGVLIFPLILAFASEAQMGMAFSIAGIGMVAGSLVMSVWGGPKRRINGLYLGGMMIGVTLGLAGLRPSIVLVTIAATATFFVLPIANGSSQAIWQSKVEPDIQGKVFAVRRLIAQIAGPVAIVAAGPLADRVFEPLLAEGGALAGSIGRIVGTGPGRGIGFLFIVLGALCVLATLVLMADPHVRNVEDELPDVTPADLAEPVSPPDPAAVHEAATHPAEA